MINLDTDKPGQRNTGYRNVAMHIRGATNPGFLPEINSPQGEFNLGVAILAGVALAELLAAIFL